MIKEFKILCRIALRHAFYADGSGRNLELVPAPGTRAFMRRYDLHWRPEGSEFILLFGKESSKQPALAYLNAGAILRFYLRSKNPYFFNITAIPFLDGDREKFYFHNLDKPLADEHSVSLAATEIAGKEDIMPVYDRLFEFISPTAKILSLRDGLGRLIDPIEKNENAGDEENEEDLKKALWEPLPPPAAPGTFRFNLQRLPPGKYGLELEPGRIHWVYCAEEDLKYADLGILDLYIGKESPQMIAPPKVDAAVPEPPGLYHIAFENRATRWRYFVVNRSQLSFERMDVTDGKVALDFVNEAPRMLRSGIHMAIPVSSNNALALREQPQLKPKLKLVGKEVAGASNGNSMTIDLPTPDWRNLSPEGSGADQQVYSDMYVFL